MGQLHCVLALATCMRVHLHIFIWTQPVLSLSTSKTCMAAVVIKRPTEQSMDMLNAISLIDLYVFALPKSIKELLSDLLSSPEPL